MISACTPRRIAASLLVLAAAASCAQALESDRDQPLEVIARSSSTDLRTGLYVLTGNVEIHQGSLHIRADRGEVHRPGEDEDVTRVVLEGSPATLEQALDNAAGHMRARARRIDYDRRADVVVLTGGVRIEEPRGTLTGERVTYDVARGRVQGESGGEDGRVRFVIPPRARDAGSDAR